ncbi:PadR family transcriptional regulator [Roseateles asaccharophilus]|uniref:PadR family transcriptional regulator PadR n=1 Tax=Roseateles asaccharophilus TaxID=582607 RepID=A0ABU2AER0_9BURK|nr:PadR family transcriptional regulator [Roseateles asaccharophilus]MDR7335687.1 PadR family transcriptional regulator PadR [Roseateles asaccharophilus]
MSEEEGDSQERWQVQMRKGTLELAVLAALRGGARYGLDLLRRLQEFPTTAISEGTLYPLLDRLKRDGLLDAHWVQEGDTRPRKYYQLSDKGLQRLATLSACWLQTADDIGQLLKRAAPHDGDTQGGL